MAARAGFVTQAAPSNYTAYGPAKAPPAASAFEIVRYRSPAGNLVAYLTRNPGDGKKRPGDPVGARWVRRHEPDHRWSGSSRSWTPASS